MFKLPKCKVLAIAVLAVSVFIAQQNAIAQTSPAELAKAWEDMTALTMEIAKLMPAEHFTFTPVEGLRTFDEQLYHVGDHSWMGRNLKANIAKLTPHKDKEKAIAEVQKGHKMIADAIRNLKESDLKEEVTLFGQKKLSRLGAILFMIDHHTHTRGIMYMYLRAKGIDPPDYRGW